MSDASLDEIFNNDPLNILNIERKVFNVKSEEQRLIDSFSEIAAFFIENKREPNPSGISEFQLYSRLNSIRNDPKKVRILAPHDHCGLLRSQISQIKTMDGIVANDALGILNSEAEDIFEFKHVTKIERNSPDYIARRKPCLNFDKYESKFLEVHADLISGRRKLIELNSKNFREGDIYVLSGVLVYLESAQIKVEKQEFTSGSRQRVDGRTRCIFENGTESTPLLRSLEKSIQKDGFALTEKIQDFPSVDPTSVTKEDKEAGFVYILRSKSTDPAISSLKDLYKIGFTEGSVEQRIRNASKETTYLMAGVSIVMTFKCFNMNPQKLERLLHRFFGMSQLNIDVRNEDSIECAVKEWFVAPLDVVEKAVELIISGKIVHYSYDDRNKKIVSISPD